MERICEAKQDHVVLNLYLYLQQDDNMMQKLIQPEKLWTFLHWALLPCILSSILLLNMP